MDNVQFDEPQAAQSFTQNTYRPKETKGLIAFLVNKGFAKNEKVATYILLALSVVAIAVAIIIPFFVSTPPTFTPEQVLDKVK